MHALQRGQTVSLKSDIEQDFCPLGPPLIIRLLVCFFPALPARVERAERLPRAPPRQLHQPNARPQVSVAALAAKPPSNIINLSYLYNFMIF